MPPKAKAQAPKKPAAAKAAPAKKAPAKAAAPKPRPAKKQTSDAVATIASRAMRGGALTPEEVKALAASVLSQDETKGKRGGS